MFTRDTIEKLEQADVLAKVNEALKEIPNKKSNVVAVASGINLQDIEPFMPTRNSFRGQFRTNSIDNFAEYCKEFLEEGSKCFIDSNKMYAEAILDMGTKEKPLHQKHIASIGLEQTAAFNALLSAKGRLSQRTASEFMEDWADLIKVTSTTGDPMTASVASEKLRNVTIEQAKTSNSNVGDFSETMSNFEKIEAKNETMLPASFEFLCVPYKGLEARIFNVKIGMALSSQKPEFIFRLEKQEQTQEDIALEFQEILVSSFEGTEMRTFLGMSR